MRRTVLLVVLAGLVGLVVYLGWEPMKSQVRMSQMERDPASFTRP